MEEQPENLRVGRGCPPRDEVQEEKHENSSRETSEQVEGRRSKAHGEEEQLPLCAEDGEGPRERPLNWINSPKIGHSRLPKVRVTERAKPES